MSAITYAILAFVSLAFLWAIGERMAEQAVIDRAFRDMDALHNQEWNGDDSDELMAWYRVRNRIMTNRNASKLHRQAWLHAVEVRISQCRERNTTFRTVAWKADRPTIVNTQN